MTSCKWKLLKATKLLLTIDAVPVHDFEALVDPVEGNLFDSPLDPNLLEEEERS